MFVKHVYVWSIIIVSLFGAMVYKVGSVTEKHKEQYYNLAEKDKEAPSSSDLTMRARQNRSRVRKEIWFSKGREKMYYSLRGNHSELIYVDDGDKTSVEEHMEGVTCYMQEELFYLLPDGKEVVRHESGQLIIKGSDPKDLASWVSNKELLKPMQKIRYIEAEKGVYHYSRNTFIAEKVIIRRFIAEGHDLVEDVPIDENIMMKGMAKSVEFTFGDEDINFKAHHLKAIFYSLGGAM